MAASSDRIRRIEVDHDRCVGSQMCMGIAPGTFEPDDGGLAVVRKQDGDPFEDVLEAEENCPVAAITVDLESGEDTP